MGVKIRQRDITDCGAACIASVSEYYKLKLSVFQIRQIAGTDQKGTNVLGMIKAAEQLGFDAKGVKGKVDALSKIPLPAIAHVIIKVAHFVVIYKINNNKIKYMDPADGQLHTVSIDEFSEIWSGVLILIAPSDNFLSKNEKTTNTTRFFSLIKPHRSIIIQCLFGAIIYTILGLSTSIYIGKITDIVLINENSNLLNLMSIGMIFILIIRIFLGFFQKLFILNTGQKIDVQLILGYYKHLLKLPQNFFDTMRIGEIISRLNDAIKIRKFINEESISLVVNICIIFFSFILMFLYSWKLALIMSIIIPFYSIIYLISNRLNKSQERKVMEDSSVLESQFIESLDSIKTIKQFGIEEYSNFKTENSFIRLLKTTYRSSINSISINESITSINFLFTVILLWTGSYLVLNGEITIGTLFSVYAIIGYFTLPMASVVNANKTMQNALIAADRLFEIMDLEYEKNESKINFTSDNKGNIRFDSVSFSYGNKSQVFNKFSLSIDIGKVTAIIGGSGSGKSTLALLLQKMYPIDGGNIYIGSQNIDYFSNESLRSKIATVPQEVNLFSGTVVENIALGEFYPNMEHILSICNNLGITSFIEQLPDGFATQIGENGVGLSGGEKQKLAIARALYKDPEILILDEATSSLDSKSEDDIQKAILHLNKTGKTIIIIAHRLSTVMTADKILLLSQGTLIEEGTHQELYKEGTNYHNMWKKQIPIK